MLPDHVLLQSLARLNHGNSGEAAIYKAKKVMPLQELFALLQSPTTDIPSLQQLAAATQELSGRNMTSAEMKAIEEIKVQLNSSTLPGIEVRHVENQQHLDQMASFLQICNNELATGNESSGGLQELEASVQNLRAVHASCRVNQSTLHVESASALQSLQSFLIALELPEIKLPEPRAASDLMDRYFAEQTNPYLVWLAQKSANYLLHKEISMNISTGLAELTAACNEAQLNFELEYCKWSEKESTMASMYSVCWKESMRIYTEAAEKAEADSASLKVQFVSVHNVLCYMSNLSVSSAQQAEELQKCSSLELSTDFLNIVLSTLPNASQILQNHADSQNTSGYQPGDAEWQKAEYNSLLDDPHAAPVRPCTPHTTTTTTTVLAWMLLEAANEGNVCGLDTTGQPHCFHHGSKVSVPDQKLTSLTADMIQPPACGLDANGKVHCWGSNKAYMSPPGWVQMGLVPPPADLPVLKQLQLGHAMGCGIETSGAIRCWEYQVPEGWRRDVDSIQTSR